MKEAIIFILTLITFGLTAQSDSTWKTILIEPDLLSHFPETPAIDLTKQIKSYEYKIGQLIYRVTSEKSPIIYYGRTIKEVDEEYYSTLTSKTITSKQKLIKENDFKFEGHNVRELIFIDTLNLKPCTVILQILNVTGFEEAMYKFYLIDFENRTTIPEISKPFFKNWDLYYKLENKIVIKNGKTDEILEDNGFIIEKENKRRKRKQKK
jgi:hypothetical protein